MVLPVRPSCRSRPPAAATVQEALRRHLAGYAARPEADPAHLHVLRRIVTCRTPAMGTHLCVCASCGWSGHAFNSCRDRHCAQCQGRETAGWLAARQRAMLPVPHFQVVFTLPAALREVARRNPRRVYTLMFAAAAGVLRDLAAQRLGARLGISAVLHTWERALHYHPHVHCLVTAGGLALDGERWVPSRPGFLFPQRIMGMMFRGRVLEGLIEAFEAGELDLGDEDPVAASKAFRSTVRDLSRRHARWVVHVEPPNGRPVAHIARYLARYVKRVAIGDARIVAVTDRSVTFLAKERQVCISGVEFVRRFAQHILPSGFRKVRHYGLYAPGGASVRRERARALVADEPEADEADDVVEKAGDETEQEAREPCPSCGVDAVQRVFLGAVSRPRARGPP